MRGRQASRQHWADHSIATCCTRTGRGQSSLFLTLLQALVPLPPQVKVSEYNSLKTQLNAVVRKQTGSLSVRDISTLVKPQVCRGGSARAGVGMRGCHVGVSDCSHGLLGVCGCLKAKSNSEGFIKQLGQQLITPTYYTVQSQKAHAAACRKGIGLCKA